MARGARKEDQHAIDSLILYYAPSILFLFQICFIMVSGNSLWSTSVLWKAKIGHPYDYTDELRASIGHEGRIEFIPEVYWIQKENALYSVISAWDINTVPEANGLKSAYATDDLIELFSAEKRYARPQFIHE